MMDLEGVRDWLTRYRDICVEIDSNVERVELLRQRLEAVNQPSLDGMPHSPGYKEDKIGTIIGRIDEIEQDTRDLINQSNQIKKEIEEAISKINKGNYKRKRAIIIMRYIDFLKITDIAYALFCNEKDFEQKYETKIRIVSKYQKQALLDLQKILSVEPEKSEIM